MTATNFSAVPEALKSLPNWVAWKLVNKNGEDSKVPFVFGSDQHASSTDSSTWVDFATAQNATISKTEGIGFVIGGAAIEQQIVGFDIDGCCNSETGEVTPWADQIIDLLDSYAEYTPSGTGIRIWVRGVLPENHTKVFKLDPDSGYGDKVQIEVYNRDRYFTVTGESYYEDSTGIEVRDVAKAYQLVREIQQKHPFKSTGSPDSTGSTDSGLREGAKIESSSLVVTDKYHLLMHGKIVSTKPFVIESGRGSRLEYPSQSEADMALCTMSALKHGNSPDQIWADYASSRLFREKWGDREEYFRKHTIAAAIKTAERMRSDSQPPNVPTVNPAQADAVTVTDWKDSFKSVGQLEDGDVQMLIDGVLPEGTTCIGGLPGEGKTLFALSIVKALTTGEKFLGRFSVPGIVPVIYLIPESGGRAFKKRCRKFGIPDDANRFVCRTISEGALIGLTNPILAAAVQAMRPVVVLDTMIRFSGASDENSAAQNKQLADAIIALRQMGAIAVIALHHATKDLRDGEMTLEKVLRGSTDIAAMADAVWGLKRDSALYDNNRGPNEIDIVCVKPRDFDPALPFRVAATRKTEKKQGIIATDGTAPGTESVIDRFGDLMLIEGKAIQAGKDEQLTQLVTEYPAISITELVEATGMKYWIVQKNLKRLDWVKSKGGRGRSIWVRGTDAEPRAPIDLNAGGPTALN